MTLKNTHSAVAVGSMPWLDSDCIKAAASGDAGASQRRHSRDDSSLALLGESEGPFSVIYADPPWKYAFPGTRAEKHDDYPTMPTTEICRLPVEQIAATNCVIFMWGIWTKLVDTVRVMEAWGFEYKTVGFVWVKTNKRSDSDFFGMGSWTRSNTEYCLIGTRGNPKRISASVGQVIRRPIMRHSEKPPEARERIVALMGDISRVELFARVKTEGWSAWGNESSLTVAAHPATLTDEERSSRNTTAQESNEKLTD